MRKRRKMREKEKVNTETGTGKRGEKHIFSSVFLAPSFFFR